MRADGVFNDPDVHAWVDLLTNFASLPSVRFEHVRALSEGRVPIDIVNTVMHEMMHHWCFFSPVGEVLALLRYRVRHALLTALQGEKVNGLDVACDLTRYEAVEKALSPIIEGLALFTEHDAVTSGSDESYCRPLHQFSLFILHELVNSSGPRLLHVSKVDDWLQKNRTRPEGVDRKADLLALPLELGKNIYLAGYLTLKTFVGTRNRFFGGSYDKLLAYLRSYFFQDYGLVDAMYGTHPRDDDPITIVNRISEYMTIRMRDLFQRDLTADVAQWSPSEPSEESEAVGNEIKLAPGLTYRLYQPIRGINVPAEPAARGYSWHRDLFRVFDTSDESLLLDGHKLRGLREFICRSLMPICSERIRAHTVDGMVEARDSEDHAIARMQKIADFDEGQAAVVESFFIPGESAMLGAIFVDGAAVGLSLQGETKVDVRRLVTLLEPSSQQLEALERSKKLDQTLVREQLAVYDGLMAHVRRGYVGMQDAIYRPPVSFLLCAPDADWHKTLSQLDDFGLMAVLDTKMQLRDIARLSLLASRPRAPADLRADFAQAGRNVDAVLALIRHLHDSFGLDLIDTTMDDQIFSVV